MKGSGEGVLGFVASPNHGPLSIQWKEWLHQNTMSHPWQDTWPKYLPHCLCLYARETEVLWLLQNFSAAITCLPRWPEDPVMDEYQ